jgi:hypothetical protein
VRPKPLVIGPATVEEIADRLKVEGLVYHSRLAPDILRAVLNGFPRKGRATIRTELEAPGFYEVEDKEAGIKKIIVVGYEVEEPTVGELRESLELLNELAGVWFKHVVDRFSTVVKWAAIAPFNFIYKGRGRWFKWLYLYGATNTGKTTLALIATAHMWGFNEFDRRKSGSFIDTKARFGHVISQYTFPVVIDEPGSVLRDPDIADMVKLAVQNVIVRGRHHGGGYVEYPALAPMVFTSNTYLPRDAALLKRFKVLRFTPKDMIPQGRVREFDTKVRPRLTKLKAIGQFIASYVLKNGLGEDPEVYAVKLLEEAYKAAGLEVPAWIHLGGFEDESEGVEEVYESVIEQVRGYILKRVNEEYNRYVGRVDVETPEGIDRRYRWQIPVEERVKIVLEHNLIPWLLSRGEEVIITRGLVEELLDVVGDIGGLEGLAQLMGWEHAVRRIGGRNTRVAVTTVRDLVKLLAPPID